jgi:hypothetical protein
MLEGVEGVWCDPAAPAAPLLGQLFGQFQQCKDDRLGALLVDFLCLFFGQCTLPKNTQQTRRQSRLACCHAP